MEQNPDIFVIGKREDFTPTVGTLVSMLTNSRHFLNTATRGLTTEDLDSQNNSAPNSIGAILAHLAAAESLFQCMTFEDRQFNDEETKYWGNAFQFKACERNQKRSLDSYLQELNTIRQQTLAKMQERDDVWLESSKEFFGNPGNIHYYWFHYLQDEVRHTGQITMMRKHLIANNNPDFNAYDFRKKV